MKYRKRICVILVVMILICTALLRIENKITNRTNNQLSIEIEERKINKEKKLLDEISPSIVKIHSGGYMGSGMIFKIEKEEIIIVTNKHLVMNDSKCDVDFYGVFSVQADQIQFATQGDIAFIKIACASLSEEQLTSISFVNTDMAYDEIAKVGGNVIQIGSIDGPAQNISKGTILAIRQFDVAFYTEMLVTECEAQTGMSGGGVFDEEGHLLAMITGGDMTEETRDEGTDKTFSIPVDQILNAWELLQ